MTSSATTKAKQQIEQSAHNHEGYYTPCIKKGCGKIVPGEMITISGPVALAGEMVCKECYDKLEWVKE